MILQGTGDTKQDRYTSGTYNGVYINVILIAAAVNTALLVADFDAALIAVKVVLKEKGKSPKIVMQDSLKLLGSFNALQKGYFEFTQGLDKAYAGVATKNSKVRTVFLDFGGHIRLDGSEMVLELIMPATGVFTAAVDASSSYIEFWASPSVGYSPFIPQTRFEVVQQSTSNQPFNIGDNVTRLAFLNFDKNTLVDEVITQLSLQSDRLDCSYTFNQLIALNATNYDDIPNYRYGSVLPISLTDATGRVYRGLESIPQSLMLWMGDKIDNELDNVRLTVSFNSANVAASQNWIGWRTYETTQEMVNEALGREAKHMQEKIQKTPTA